MMKYGVVCIYILINVIGDVANLATGGASES